MSPSSTLGHKWSRAFTTPGNSSHFLEGRKSMLLVFVPLCPPFSAPHTSCPHHCTPQAVPETRKTLAFVELTSAVFLSEVFVTYSWMSVC